MYSENKGVPNIKTYVRQLFVRQVLTGCLLAVGMACYTNGWPWAWLWGILAGWGDNALVLRGIAQGMEKDLVGAVRHMRGTMFLRLGLLLTAVVLGHYLGITAYSVFMAFIFLHITLVGNMLMMARKNTPGGAKQRSEADGNSGSC